VLVLIVPVPLHHLACGPPRGSGGADVSTGRSTSARAGARAASAAGSRAMPAAARVGAWHPAPGHLARGRCTAEQPAPDWHHAPRRTLPHCLGAHCHTATPPHRHTACLRESPPSQRWRR
jgi:hypothetical protein